MYVCMYVFNSGVLILSSMMADLKATRPDDFYGKRILGVNESEPKIS